MLGSFLKNNTHFTMPKLHVLFRAKKMLNVMFCLLPSNAFCCIIRWILFPFLPLEIIIALMSCPMTVVFAISGPHGYR